MTKLTNKEIKIYTDKRKFDAVKKWYMAFIKADNHNNRFYSDGWYMFTIKGWNPWVYQSRWQRGTHPAFATHFVVTKWRDVDDWEKRLLLEQMDAEYHILLPPEAKTLLDRGVPVSMVCDVYGVDISWRGWE